MRNRDRMNIISRILEAVNGSGDDGVPTTRIMYNAFVSHAQLKQYLAMLADNGMVQYGSKSQAFKITEKGLMFLRAYREIDEMIKIPPPPRQKKNSDQLIPGFGSLFPKPGNVRRYNVV